jgi:acetate kinase
MLGVSGKSSDYRDLEAGMNDGDKRCELAFNMFLYSLVKLVGGYVAAMNGVDAVVFTGGLGENNGLLREKVMESFSFMGVKVDSEKNAVRGENKIVSSDDSTVKVMVVPTDEEMMIAIDTKALTE